LIIRENAPEGNPAMGKAGPGRMDSHDKNANSRCRVGSLLNPPPLEMVFGEVHKGCIDELIIDGEFNPSGFNPPYDLRLIYFLLRINYFTISLTVFSRSEQKVN
jgi:hypothetical protein